MLERFHNGFIYLSVGTDIEDVTKRFIQAVATISSETGVSILDLE